jgi:sulfoxide reductase heme-binding subunit YedZ
MQIVSTINSAARRVPTWAVYIVLAIPAVLLTYALFTNQLGSDPIREYEHEMGEWALKLIIAGLLITPLRDWFKLNLIKYRRAIGVMAFTYTFLHLTSYLVLDQSLIFSEIWKDIVKRPYITFGMASALMMLPLAITSNNWSIRKLGPQKWNKLHKLVYLAGIGAVMHYLLLTKTWEVEPAVYVVILFGLLTHRVLKVRKQRMRALAA